MRITIAALALALAVFAPAGAYAQTSTPFDGKWEGTYILKNLDGTDRPASPIIFNLVQKGKELSGTAGPADQQEKVVGTVADGKATFEVIMPSGPPFKFSLTIVKGRLQGDMTRDQNGTLREAKVDAAKVAAEKKSVTRARGGSGLLGTVNQSDHQPPAPSPFSLRPSTRPRKNQTSARRV